MTRKALHLPDGVEQRKRDEAIGGGGREGGQNPDLWADREWQGFMWGELMCFVLIWLWGCANVW